ncbi:MAG TPA: DUF1987 domain-containing protein [Caulobacteraceae bacterium]|jgi:hypothetical protein
MDDLHIPGTRQSPAVDFWFSQHRFRLQGEAYPENATAFFEPLTQLAAAYAARPSEAPVRVELRLRYLNSASTKLLFKWVSVWDRLAETGRPVHLTFETAPDDEVLQEFGEDLKTDFSWLDFEIVEIA